MPLLDVDLDTYRCAACGRLVDDHALAVNAEGVVTAGTYTDPNTFTICAEGPRSAADLADEVRRLREIEAELRQFLTDYGHPLAALWGCAPDATGGVPSEDFVRQLRDQWDG